MKNTKKRPQRWEFLDELEGRPADTTPVRSLYRKPALWEIMLYAAAGLLWLAAAVLAVMGKYGATGLTLLGICVCCLRFAVFELRRRRRCKGSLLGTVESFTRRPYIRKKARYPVIRFEVNGTIYFAYRQKPAHPSTLGNEEWVRYNLANPADNFVASDSNPKLSVGLTLVTAFLGVAFLMIELDL